MGGMCPATTGITRRIFAFQAIIWALAVAGALQAAEPAKTVKLTIDYGDGVQKVFSELAWKEGLTVFAALGQAAEHPRGIKLTHQGQGATTLVTAIDDLKNEGRGRNWVYDVNGKLADRGCGVWELQAGDAVLWRFGGYK